MKSKTIIWSLFIVLTLSLAGVAATSAQGDQATLVIINFVGGEMTFTLDGTTYSVPGVDTVPDGGQLTLALSPGKHKYSGHVPGSDGTNGEADLAAGQTFVLGARLQRSDPVLSPAGVVLEAPRDTLVFFEASLMPSAPASEPQPMPLQQLPAGQGALVFVNYIGEALMLDIGGDIYSVPANDRLQVDLPPGEVSYSASVGPSGLNATAQVTAGAYTGLGFTRDIPPEEPDYEEGKLAPTPVPLGISVFPVPLEDEPIAQPTIPTPLTASPPAGQAESGEPPVPVSTGQGALNVVNYIGETLTFTIDGQAYPVAGDGGTLNIDLAPGEYTYTASTPRAAANGSLGISDAVFTQLSVTLDANSGEIKIYVE